MLKVLTRKFSSTIARSRLLPLIGFPLWLPPSQRGSLVLLPSLALICAANREGAMTPKKVHKKLILPTTPIRF